MADKDKKKKHGKPPWMDDDDEKDEEDDEKKSFRGGGMNELEKAGRELQQTLHGEQTGERRPSLRDAIEGFTSNLARSAKELTDFLGKAEGYGAGSSGDSEDSGNDPEYRMTHEYKKLAKRKRGASQNSSDNESYEEQEREQEETIEEAENEMDGSTLVSGAGKRNADFHDQGGGRRIALPDHEGGVDKSSRRESVDQFYRSLADNDEFVQVLEASPALAHLSDVVAERLADLEERITSKLNMLGKSMAILMRSQAQFNKSFVSAPDGSSRTSPGIIGRTTDGKGPEGVFTVNGNDPSGLGKSNGTSVGALRKSEIASKIEAAISDGKADPMELARFDAAGLNGLGMDDDTRKQYGIPLNPRQ